LKILLIWPNSRNEVLGWGDLGAISEPLALEYLATAAKLDSHEVQVLDLRLHPQELKHTLQAFTPDVVGVTAFSMHVRTALAICRQVKDLLPRCWTVIGGHHATFLPEDFFEPQIDFVVFGEGVRPFRALLRALETNCIASHVIPSVWSRVGERFILGESSPAPDSLESAHISEPKGAYTANNFSLDALPFPDRSVTVRDRHSYFIDWMRPIALIRTTVGCPYRCTFCSLWKIMDGRYFMRDIESVVEEMQKIREDFVFLVDDEAFINQKRMLALAHALRAAGLYKRYFAYCRIDTLLRQRTVLAAWREIGLERLFVGIDAISDQELRDYNKRCQIVQIEAGLAAAEELGIEIFAQFVVNPNYTRRDFQQLVRFIEHHRLRYPTFTILTPIPGTELLGTFDSVIERQPNGRPNWDLFDCQNAVTKTTLPKEQFRREYRNLYRVFNGSYTQYREHNYLIDGP